jgi:hypothetical protein
VHLKYLDISFCPSVTDEGLSVFQDRPRKIRHLKLNAMEGVTSEGIKHIVMACREDLLDF